MDAGISLLQLMCRSQDGASATAWGGGHPAESACRGLVYATQDTGEIMLVFLCIPNTTSLSTVTVHMMPPCETSRTWRFQLMGLRVPIVQVCGRGRAVRRCRMGFAISRGNFRCGGKGRRLFLRAAEGRHEQHHPRLLHFPCGLLVPGVESRRETRFRPCSFKALPFQCTLCSLLANH